MSRSVGTLSLAALLCGVLVSPVAAQEQSEAVDTAAEPTGFIPLARGTGIAALDSRGSASYDGVPLRVILESLTEQAGLSLTYSPDLEGLGQPITLALPDASHAEAMIAALAGSGLRMLVSRGGVAVLVRAGAQRIGGRVLDRGSGGPVAGARVRVVGAGGGTDFTDAAGRFTLEAPGTGVAEVQVTAPGYAVAVARAGTPHRRGSKRLEVLLTPAAIALPEIVVTPGRFGILAPVGGTASFTHAEAAAAPQIGADVMRVAARVPGVSTDDVSARLAVRGAWPDELRIQLDGLVLHEPYHLRDVDAALSVVDVNAMESVALVAGGATAEHGDALGGVLELKTRTRPEPGRTALGLTVSSVDALTERPFAQGRGLWLVSARRGYVDLLLDLGRTDDSISPRYHDVLGKVLYRLSDSHQLSAHLLHAGDDFRWDDRSVGSTARSSWANSYGWIRWRVAAGPGVEATTLLAVARLSRNRLGGRPDGAADGGFTVDDRRSFREVSVRQDWSWHARPRHSFKAGFEIRRGEAAYDYHRTGGPRRPAVPPPARPTGETASLVRDVDGTVAGVYGAWRAQPVDPLTVEAGLRWDRYEGTDEVHLSPRLNAAWMPAPRTTLRASWGLYTRGQRLDELEVADGVTQLRHAEKATSVVVGADHAFGAGFTARAEAYWRTVAAPRPVFLNVLNGLDIFPEATSDRVRLDPTSARARGVELSLRGTSADGRWDWRGSWTLAEAVDRVDGIDVPRLHDQRHTVQLYGSWTSDMWRVSASWRFHTGWPTTARTFTTEQTSMDETVLVGHYRPIHGARLPAYHRLDLRVTRRFDLRRGRLEVFADLFNAYDRANARGADYIPVVAGDRVEVRRELETMLPLLPTGGVRWVF